MLIFAVAFDTTFSNKAFKSIQDRLLREDIKLVLVASESETHDLKKTEFIMQWVDGLIFFGKPYEGGVFSQRARSMLLLAEAEEKPVLSQCKEAWFLHVMHEGLLHQEVIYLKEDDRPDERDKFSLFKSDCTKVNRAFYHGDVALKQTKLFETMIEKARTRAERQPLASSDLSVKERALAFYQADTRRLLNQHEMC